MKIMKALANFPKAKTGELSKTIPFFLRLEIISHNRNIPPNPRNLGGPASINDQAQRNSPNVPAVNNLKARNLPPLVGGVYPIRNKEKRINDADQLPNDNTDKVKMTRRAPQPLS